MKRALFYTLLLFQVIVVLLVVVQYNLIDTYGEERTFITVPYPDEEYYPDDEFYMEEEITDYDMYSFEFAINNIPKDKWEGKKDYNYRDRVYVLLQKNDSGIYEVVKATDKKITTSKENEVVLIGNNIYEDENDYHVSYGFENINVDNHKKILKDFDMSKENKVTFKVTPWKQGKLIKVE